MTTKSRKVLERVLAGSKDIRFNEAVALAEGFGFHLSRVSGSHHIFVHPQVRELVNLQNVNGQALSNSPTAATGRAARFTLEG